MAETSNDLRWVLRDATGEDHRRLDALVADLDLGTEAGLVPFLRANALAYGALLPADPALHGHVSRRLALIDTDLAALGAGRPASMDALAAPAQAAALGFRYVIAGSALGGTVLARIHAGGGNARVLAAGRFLGDTELMALWRAVIVELGAYGGPHAPVIEGARQCFRLFERCFEAALCEEATLVR
ncbi:MAG: biliverdin-producing heme oxygenase [Pseudomonadota bacterium]